MLNKAVMKECIFICNGQGTSKSGFKYFFKFFLQFLKNSKLRDF